MTSRIDSLPSAFVWRRLHSLTGMWLVIFLLEHLITNSQAALLLGDSGKGFIRAVNFIHNLPYLTVIEVTLLGLPILIHMIWGIKYARTAKPNSMGSGGSKPHLKYSRNRAYTWQRITSWILVVLLTVHVVKFRFVQYPHTVNPGGNTVHFVKIETDRGLPSVAKRLDVQLYTASEIANMSKNTPLGEALENVHLKEGQVIAATEKFGTASLLTVRNTFKSWFWVSVYTVFVLSACFHAFNGLWTSMLTWGWVIKMTAQTRARRVAFGLMGVIAFLGLAAVWGTYFLNLKK